MSSATSEMLTEKISLAHVLVNQSIVEYEVDRNDESPMLNIMPMEDRAIL